MVKLLILAFILTITACQQEKADLSLYVAKIKERPKVTPEPVPLLQAYERFEYAASELRNPFLPPVVVDLLAPSEVKVKIDNGILPNMDRRKENLEGYDLTELSLVGTMEQDTIWALIRSPDGEIHRVQSGNYMGKNYGEILTISDVKVTLQETVPDGDGGYIYREQDILSKSQN